MDGFYDVTTNQFITFQGDTSASFYLQVSGGDGTTEAPQLTSLQVAPLSLVGGAGAQGVVTLSQVAPAGGAIVDLDSDDPSRVSVPATVTVPAGQTSASFSITTAAVTAQTTVGVAASFGGIIRSVVMILAPPPAGDQVSISQAEYRASKRQLRVSATSSNASATLTVFVTATGAQIGTLTDNGGGSFQAELSWPVNPQNITVRSSAGGSATAAVTAH